MRQFFYVTGQVVEVQRHINVPMRWCEQYPARERRELWVTAASGHDTKVVVHSRVMPARRGHRVTILLLGELVVGLRNASTGTRVNFVREDPPLLLRRCDGVAALCLVIGGISAVTVCGWKPLLLSVPITLLHLPLLVVGRLALRGHLQAQVNRALEILTGPEVARPSLRRVK